MARRAAFVAADVGTDGFVGALCASRVFDFAHAGDDVVGRHYQVVDVGIVAGKGGVVLVMEAGDKQQGEQGQGDCTEALQQFTPPTAVSEAHAQVKDGRDYAEGEQPKQQWPGQQFGALGWGGNQHVGQHRAVEIDAKEDDAVTHRRREQQDERHEYFVQPGQKQQVQEDIERAEDE